MDVFKLLCIFTAALHCSSAQSGSRDFESGSGDLESGSGNEPSQPGPPTNVQVFALNSTAVRVSWSAPISDLISVTGYQVTYSAGRTNEVRLVSANVFTLTVLGLESGVEYRFSVAALNAAGISPFQTLHLTLAGSIVIGMEFDSYTVEEADSVRVCVQVTNGALDQIVILELRTALNSGTLVRATAGSDYSSVTSTQLAFNSLVTSSCVSISTRFDNLVEGTESFLVQLRTISPLPSSVKLARNTSTVFILDDDEVEVRMQSSSITIFESGGSVRVCATVDRAFRLQRSVQVTAHTQDGTATAPLDYIATTTELTFTRSRSSACVSIRLVDDELYDTVDGEMFFTVVLELNDSAVIPSSRGTTISRVNLRENDALVIGLEREHYAVSETIRAVNVSSSGNRTGANTTVIQQTSVRVCAVVFEGTIAPGANALVRFLTQSGSAGSDDYTILDRQVPISESGIGCVDIQVRDDIIAEDPEQFFVSLSEFGDRITISPSRATITILDDGDEPFMVGLEFDNYTVIEESSVQVCARVNGPIRVAVILQLSTASSLNSETPATSDVDYPSVPGRFTNGRLILSSSTPVACLSISTSFDILMENTEDFLIQLQSTGFLPPSVKLGRTNATVFILDNDDVEIAFEQSSYTANEGDRSVQVCVVLALRGSLQGSGSVQVTVNTEDGTATAPNDYIPLSAVLIFNSTHERSCISIALVDDRLHDSVDGRMFFLAVLESNDSAVSFRQGPSRVSVNILENDELVIGLERESYTVSESIRVVTVSSSGNSTSENTTVVQQTSVRVCAVVLNGTIDTGTNALVRFNTHSDTATCMISGITAECTEGNVRLVGGRAPFEGRVEVCFSGRWGTVCDDGWGTQDAEVVCRQLGYSSQGAITRYFGRGIGRIWLDNVQCSGQESRLTDCRHLGIGIIRSCDHNEDVGVSCPAGCNGDFNNITDAEVRISDNRTGCIDIQIRDDSIAEGPEQFFVALSVPFGTRGITIQPNSTATVTILDDGDVAIFGFTRTEYSVVEGSNVFVSLGILQGSLGPNFRMNVRIYTMDGSATDPGDYPFFNTTTNTSSLSNTFEIATAEDEIFEDVETFFLRLELTKDTDITIQLVEAVLTILDNDGIAVGLEETAYHVQENAGMVEICAILLRGVLERKAEVMLYTTDDSATAPADYSTTSTILTFDENISRPCGSVPIELDNTIEIEEFFSVGITTTDPDISVMTDTVRVTISDRSAVVIGFETETYEASEGQRQELCVAILEGVLESPVEVTLSTEDGTASAPGDYSSGNLQIVFTQKADQMCVHIPIANDAIAEDAETFFAKLSTQDLRISLLPATAIITIVDDDDEEENTIATPAVELCLPYQVARVSIRAVLSGSPGIEGNQCPATQGLQSSFAQFLRNQILATTSFGPGCTFLSAKLSSCVTRSGRTIASITADFTCNGSCIRANRGVTEDKQLLVDVIAAEQSVSTIFEGGTVRITYFRRGQQSAMTTVCSAGVAIANEDNLCNCPADC